MGLGARERNSDDVRTAHVRGVPIRVLMPVHFKSFRPLQKGREGMTDVSLLRASRLATMSFAWAWWLLRGDGRCSQATTTQGGLRGEGARTQQHM